MRCPICGRPVRPEESEAPFCSERCRLLDLDNWLEGRYRIPGEQLAPPPEEDRSGDEDEPSGDGGADSS